MIQTVSNVALAVITVSALAASWRVFTGPSMPDRIVALDTISVHVIAAIALFCIRQGHVNVIDSVLVIAVLSFVSTIAVAKFIVKGVIVDRSDR